VRALSFALLDVDLYRSTKKALRDLYDVLSPGGIIAVDDCDSSNVQWDGAAQAYIEFTEDINQDGEIVLGKIGLIKKPD
jgi:O-methyltransferase